MIEINDSMLNLSRIVYTNGNAAQLNCDITVKKLADNFDKTDLVEYWNESIVKHLNDYNVKRSISIFIKSENRTGAFADIMNNVPTEINEYLKLDEEELAPLMLELGIRIFPELDWYLAENADQIDGELTFYAIGLNRDNEVVRLFDISTPKDMDIEHYFNLLELF